MAKLMRCPYCGLLQDEPIGEKSCSRCGGGLEFENQLLPGQKPAYLQAQLELDQVAAPASQNVERYILLTIRAPEKVSPEEAAPVGKSRPPLHFAAVLDVSGSMQGEKIIQVKEAVRQAVCSLHTGDIFSMVTFSNEVRCPFKPSIVNDQTFQTVEGALKEITAGGMTALCSGLEKGIENAHRKKQDTDLVLLLSDGQANVGETDLEKIGQRAWQARQDGLVVSALGVGLDYNEALMTEIATQGGGRFYHIEDSSRIPAFVAGELGEVAGLAAREVVARLNIPKGATLIPLSAAYPVQQMGEQAVVTIGDIPCDTELEIPLRLALLAQADGAKLSLDGILEFHSPAGHSLQATLNRVTVRFKEREAFQFREGMILPVVERVFTQLKATCVLSVARARALRPAEAEKQSQTILENLQAYASLLGEERAKMETETVREQFVQYAASPAAAKMALANASRIQRGSKDFNRDKK
jgi:Ca-activated chloride channel family protein